MTTSETSRWMKDQLRQARYKITQPRQQIIAWISQYAGVFSAKEIAAHTSGLDRVSLYRVLDLLVELDLIHSVLLRHGEQHYELHEQNHHHHAVCDECESTACISCELPKNKRVRGFGQLHHAFVYTGLCATCTVKTSS